MKYLILTLFIILNTSSSASELQSECFGSTQSGSLKRGVALPESGPNFVSYSFLASNLGRTYVHSEVKSIMLQAYKGLHRKTPSKVFKYAETGHKNGGQFKPHKTHQNGLSVDHMVPVTRNGKSVHLPTNLSNKLGYAIEFSTDGIYKDYRIDFESLAALITEIHLETLNHGHEIRRVIFDPKMTPYLYRTSYGNYLKKNIQFSKKRSWVRHDEHIHIDFKIPCQ